MKGTGGREHGREALHAQCPGRRGAGVIGECTQGHGSGLRFSVGAQNSGAKQRRITPAAPRP